MTKDQKPDAGQPTAQKPASQADKKAKARARESDSAILQRLQVQLADLENRPPVSVNLNIAIGGLLGTVRVGRPLFNIVTTVVTTVATSVLTRVRATAFTQRRTTDRTKRVTLLGKARRLFRRPAKAR